MIKKFWNVLVFLYPMMMADYRSVFTQRVMFPDQESTRDERLVFLGAGSHQKKDKEKKDQPKYLNSPETELFNKKDKCYDLDKARTEIEKW